MEFEYHSYLLRLWATGKTGDQQHWMASLEWVSTNEKLVFSSIEALIDYLHSITREPNYQNKKGDG